MDKQFWMAALLGTAVFGALLTGCGQSAQPNNQTNNQQNTSTTTPQSQPAPTAKKYDKAPDMKIDTKKDYTATVKTNKGDFKIHLLDDKAPLTVNNFVFLANDHFYDGVKFHRIIKSFMIQTGDPLGTGTGGPGYKFKDELPPQKEYAPGIVAMANAGPNTNGSQFFIGTGDDVKRLNQMPNYTVFGEVTEGMDTVQKIASTPVTQGPSGEASMPTEDVKIESVTIEEK